MFKKSFLLLFVLFSYSVYGLEESPRFSYAADIRYLTPSIKDPVGDVENDATLSFGGKFAYNLDRRGERVALAANYLSSDAGYGSDIIGQEFEIINISAGYEKRFSFGRSFKPWVSGGLMLTNFTSSNRYDLTPDGFFNRDYSKRKFKEFGYFAAIDFYFDLTKRFKLGTGVFYESTFDTDENSIKSFGFSAKVMFE